MGNSKSKKSQQREPDRFFERERWKEQKREEIVKKNLNPLNKRMALKEHQVAPGGVSVRAAAPQPLAKSTLPPPPPAHLHSYDDEAVEHMRYQLRNDSDAFLLNNILLSVQFFEHYDKEVQHIKSNPISERDHAINEAMVQHHKHVFFADRLLECVHEHVAFVRERGHPEPLAVPRLFVIYDNVEASEPGDTSDYSAVLDAPFYKIQIEDCKEQGYVKLKKLEVLESILTKESDAVKSDVNESDESVYTDSEKESNASDDYYASKGEELLKSLETKISNSINKYNPPIIDRLNINSNITQLPGRRRSGPVKQVSSQVSKSSIGNINLYQRRNSSLLEENDSQDNVKQYVGNKASREDIETKPRKSILKNVRRPSGPTKEVKNKQFFDLPNVTKESIAEDTETSGYRSTSSSRQNDFSGSESDYGYSTITESATPKRIELTVPSNCSVNAGVLPEECWNVVQVRAVDNWSEDEEDLDDSASKLSISRTLYEAYHYLGSQCFMNNFVDNFIINIGSSLGLTKDAINTALTQGASVYCDIIKNGSKLKCEIFPALLAAWPNAANQWIIRERRIIQNPRTNVSYQWPTKYMVNKAIGFGCLLVPVGFRPKRGPNPDQKLQWRIIFPAAERYLESCLAHSQVRCFLFTLALHKTFLENETSKIGIDAGHIKNHLFWHCEHNFARWPEDRLGETLRIFLDTFYVHFGQGKFPNYFIEACNDFKSIPKPMLMKLQKRLAEIRESPVMHILKALDKLKYIKKDFYPTLNCKRLYDILISKNPLKILNPNLPVMNKNYDESSESENDGETNFWDKAKSYDKHYQWKKEKHRQMQEKRKSLYSRKQKSYSKEERPIDTNIVLPKKMEAERKRLVLEFFISHFIAMARSSEKFEDINQALIYLEQAQRLCILLLEEPGGDSTANEFLYVVRDKLADCQRKLVNQAGFKLPHRESQMERNTHRLVLKQRQRPRYEHIVSQDSPTDTKGISAFTFVDVHIENRKEAVTLNDSAIDEESKL